MILLQIDMPQPDVLPPDSLHHAAYQLFSQMITDPNQFWTDMLQGAISFALKVLAALLIYMVGAWLISRVKKILHHIFELRKTERTLASFVTSFTTISLTTILVIISVGTLGVNTTSLAALLAAGGMAIGMALSGTVQNFAGGIMLLVFKPFRAGNYIKAQGVEGVVAEVSITATKILTADNQMIILPNGALSNGTIVNFLAQPIRRVTWSVSVAYGADAAKMREVVLGMLAEDPRILTSKDKRPSHDGKIAVNLKDKEIPDPCVMLESLNSSDITFTVRAWVLSQDYWKVYFCFNERFYTELPQHGFSFAYPHMDVHVLS